MIDKSSKRFPQKRFFPSMGGVILGLIFGVSALLNLTEHTSPFWIPFDVILCVMTFGLAAANIVGLVVVKHRKSPRTRDFT
jgi:hypothetical protein